jgi:predicted ATPase
VEAGLLQPRGAAPAASYAFKHALVQEAAYASLLKSTRQQYHARIAQALAERFPETAASEPHLLAYHYAEAGLADPAIGYWTKAAERAAVRFANREAVAGYQRALRLLESLPAGPERDGRELGLQMSVCAILPSISGYAAPETERAWLRAQELCDLFGPSNELFWVCHGLWAFHFVRARLDQARSRAESLLSLGRSRGDSLAVLDGRYAIGVTLAFQGEVSAALEHLERGIAADVADPDRPASFMPGMELGITTPSYSVMPLWLLGRADTALARAEETAERARRLGHPLTLAFALNYVAWIRLHRGEAARTRERAEELVALSEEHGLFFGPLGQTLLGWALDQRTELVPAWFAGIPAGAPLPEDGLERVAGGLLFYRATGSLVNLTQMLSLLALGQAGRERFAEAQATVNEALAFAAETGETWWTAELHRLAGELRLALAQDAVALEAARPEAEAAFVRALEIARAQGALALELRAATSRARLLCATGRRQDASQLLSASLAPFTEGLETGDLLAARALLAELP